MKTTMLLILMFYLGFSNNALGQVLTEEENQSPQELYDFHLKKKRANNLAGWLALGGGVVTVVTGFIVSTDELIDSIDLNSDTNSKNNGEWLVVAGGVMTLASIPLFISAGKHKKKAKIQLQNGAVGFTNINYTGVSLSFSF